MRIHEIVSTVTVRPERPEGLSLLKVALTACMHKLLTIMNAMVRDLKPWQPREVSLA